MRGAWSSLVWRMRLARARRLRPGAVARVPGGTMRIMDPASFVVQLKDVFFNRVYHFDAARPDPLIIDGGSSIGMSVLYFKRAYPKARVVGFEPDAAAFAVLEENVRRNGLGGVRLVRAALGGAEGRVQFRSDGSDGGRLAGGEGVPVDVEPLSRQLGEAVDLLKLNIEGEELPALEEAERAGVLGNVREVVIEYHGWPDGPQRLGALLALLERNGFRYLVHDFDAQTNPESKPPFRHRPGRAWFCLVYGLRGETRVVQGKDGQRIPRR